MKKLLPEVKKGFENNAKLMLVEQKAISWFQIAGAYFQGEFYVKDSGEIKGKNKLELHGRVAAIFPNLFIIVGTFYHNRIEKGFHYMLQNNS